MSDAHKLPEADEDPDNNGLTQKPTVRWWLWLTDAVTVFIRGILNGMFPGVGGGVAGVAMTDTTNVSDMAANGAVGLALGLLLKGLERFHLWQLQPENEMPNAFRAMPVPENPVPMVPKKDAERVLPPEEIKPPVTS